jgi:hypothetical protein
MIPAHLIQQLRNIPAHVIIRTLERVGSINAIFAGPSGAPSMGAATALADGHAVPTALANPLLY